MALNRETEIPCEQCGNEQNVVLRMQVDAAKCPQDKEDLLDGKLNRFVCSNCGYSAIIDFVLLYEDRPKGLIVMFSCLNAELTLKPGFEHFAEDYQLRFVSTRDALVEKIVIRDADLDDRVVEYVKVQLRDEMLRRSFPIDGDLRFFGIGENEEGEKVLEFQDVTGEHNDTFLVFPLASYHEFARDLGPLIAKMPKPENPWLRVDREYGKQLERLMEVDAERPVRNRRKR